MQRKEGESEDEHIFSVAHNMYMKFKRSTNRTLTSTSSLYVMVNISQSRTPSSLRQQVPSRSDRCRPENEEGWLLARKNRCSYLDDCLIGPTLVLRCEVGGLVPRVPPVIRRLAQQHPSAASQVRNVAGIEA